MEAQLDGINHLVTKNWVFMFTILFITIIVVIIVFITIIM